MRVDATYDHSTGERTETVNNLDGTGTRTTFDVDGNIVSTETITGLEIPLPPEPTPEERIAVLENLLDILLDTEGATKEEKLIAADEVRDNSLSAKSNRKL